MPDKHNGHNWFETSLRRSAWAAYTTVLHDQGGTVDEAIAAARVALEARSNNEEEVQAVLDELFTGSDPQPPP